MSIQTSIKQMLIGSLLIVVLCGLIELDNFFYKKQQHYNFEINIYDGHEVIRNFKCWSYKENNKEIHFYLENNVEIDPPFIKDAGNQSISIFYTTHGKKYDKY